LNISNAGAVSTAGDIVVGERNSTGILSLTSGGKLTTSRDAYIGRLVGSNGTATVDGSGALWTIASRLLIGKSRPATNPQSC
jgi:T5SS/PEP-CTERM-associated repeat protein